MNAKRNLILFALSTLCIAPIQAQDTLPVNHPKYQTAKTVFDDLIRAIGDGRTKPILHLLPAGGRSRMQVAWFRPDANTVTLEERAYDLCRAQGPDSLAALAALLGHELAHYYEDHGWIGDFGNGFADLEVAQSLKRQKRSPEKVVEIETQADYFGGFYGYVAGYNTLGVTPALLARIYQDYELGDDLAGYPVLAERQAIARQSEEKLRRLIPVFEAGNRLLLLKQYSGAARCFDFIGRNFRSREILNNAGAARALEALDLFPADALRFAYPFEVDAETRLNQGGQQYRSGLDESARQRRERLLEEAKSLFEQASARDPGYATAHVNLACVAELTGASQEALARAQEAVDLAQSSDEAPSLASALIIRGISRVRAGDERGGRADFKTAQSGRLALARLNQAVLDGDTATQGAGGGEKAGQGERRIGPGTPEYEALLDNPETEEELPRATRAQSEFYVFTQGDGMVIDTGASTISFWDFSGPQAGRTARGIGVGSTAAQVVEAYGQATRRRALRQGSYSVYGRSKIAFHLDAEQRVVGWLLYDVDEALYESIAPQVQEEKREPRVALVIGNGNYASGGLKNPVNDAGAMAQALKASGFVVIEKTNVVRKQMLRSIRDFGDSLAQGGIGLFYYAGHGVQVEGHNYLVPIGSEVQREDDVEAECVKVDNVMKKLESAENRVNIVILDACRNNPFPSSYRSQSQGLASMQAPDGSIVVYSTGPGKVSRDGEGANGLFTSKLLEHINTPDLEFESMIKKVSLEVKTASDGAQTPYRTSNFYGDFYLMPTDQQVTPASTPALGFTSSAAFEPQEKPADLRGGEMEYAVDFGFYIDRYEVTNAEYAEFLNKEGNLIEGGELWLDIEDEDALVEERGGNYVPRAGYADHPVVEVSWYGARSYCKWAGKRLPTDEEWKQAALDRDGRTYPWGGEEPDADGLFRANYYQNGAAPDGYEKTAPVGSFQRGASPYGALDMAGNVAEWVDTASGSDRLQRGGSWDDEADVLGGFKASDPSFTTDRIGFRCISSR